MHERVHNAFYLPFSKVAWKLWSPTWSVNEPGCTWYLPPYGMLVVFSARLCVRISPSFAHLKTLKIAHERRTRSTPKACSPTSLTSSFRKIHYITSFKKMHVVICFCACMHVYVYSYVICMYIYIYKIYYSIFVRSMCLCNTSMKYNHCPAQVFWNTQVTLAYSQKSKAWVFSWQIVALRLYAQVAFSKQATVRLWHWIDSKRKRV